MPAGAGRCDGCVKGTSEGEASGLVDENSCGVHWGDLILD
jgi:hypothetical protein